MQIDLKQSLGLGPLRWFDPPQRDNLSNGFGVEPAGLGFAVDALNVVGEGLLFFLELLDPLNKGLELGRGDAAGARVRFSLPILRLHLDR